MPHYILKIAKRLSANVPAAFFNPIIGFRQKLNYEKIFYSKSFLLIWAIYIFFITLSIRCSDVLRFIIRNISRR